MINNFEIKFAGLNFTNPLIIGSSGLTNTAEKNKELEKAGAGAIVLQSLFEEQIEIQTDKNDTSAFSKNNESVHAVKKSVQISDYLQLIQESKKQCHIPIIASIICHKPGDWIDFVRQIEMAGADAIELNIFALCTENNDSKYPLETIYLQITQKVKALVSIPVIVKMSKYFSHIVQLAADLQAAGADGIVLFSRFYHPDIDIHKLQINSGDVFSSNTDIADTLRWTPIVNGKHPDLPIASCTGIHDWEDVIKCILCGASAVEICSTVYQHGNEIISAIKRGMEEWMTAMSFHSIREFKGKLNITCMEDPSLYERIQFRKYFSERD
jgi:dihydroorotate dehydrogenase (fumarate)